MSLRTRLAGVLLAMAVPALLCAQAAPADSARQDAQNAAIRAYFDCQSFGCDRDYMVTEMKWVNWMRDRLDADFHLLVTSQETGGGGRRFEVVAIGQRAFQGKVDTLVFITAPNDAEDTIRKAMLRVMSQLLLPYAAKGALGPQLSVSYTPTATTAASSAPAKDRWNFWTFEISTNGFVNGESRQSFQNFWTEFEASRTTEQWKIQYDANYSYDYSKVQDDTSSDPLNPSYVTYTSLQRSYSTAALVTKSHGEHWSSGGGFEVRSSPYDNTDISVEVAAALEWDFFPYKDFQRRRFVVLYTLGMKDIQYREETIYRRFRDTRPTHGIDIVYGSKQTWGTAEVFVDGNQYLNGLKYYNMGLGAEIDLKIGKGLSFQLDGRISRVRDQLYLERGGATPQEVIARLRALQTDFRFFTFFGLSYKFGSIFNSVVNPRFDRI